MSIETTERLLQTATEHHRAGNLAEARTLRSQLRLRLECSALMDGARFAANIEGAYRRAWSAYCGLAAAP